MDGTTWDKMPAPADPPGSPGPRHALDTVRSAVARTAVAGRALPSRTACQSRCGGYRNTIFGVLAGTAPIAPGASVDATWRQLDSWLQVSLCRRPSTNGLHKHRPHAVLPCPVFGQLAQLQPQRLRHQTCHTHTGLRPETNAGSARKQHARDTGVALTIAPRRLDSSGCKPPQPPIGVVRRIRNPKGVATARNQGSKAHFPARWGGHPRRKLSCLPVQAVIGCLHVQHDFRRCLPLLVRKRVH